MIVAEITGVGIAQPGDSIVAEWIHVVPDAALVVDPAGAIVAANSQAALLFGYSIEALLQKNVDLLIPESIRPRHRGHRALYNAAPRQRPMALGRTLPALRADGTVINVEIALGPLDGGLTIAIVRDVSARHQQENAATQGRLIALQDQVITLLQERIKINERE